MNLKNDQIKKRNGQIDKVFMIILSLVILAFPMGFLYGLVNGREQYRNEAVESFSKSWAKEQIISTPLFDINNKHQYFDVEDYSADIKINTEIRKKGIFKIPVYVADVNLKGNLKNPYGNLNNAKIEMLFNVNDIKGFVEQPEFKIGNLPKQKSNDDLYYVTYITTSDKKIPFELNFKIRGMNSFYLSPQGVNNKFKISGNWANPSFDGDYAPISKQISSKSFTAEWDIPHSAVSEKAGNEIVDYKTIKAGVSLLTPVDNYRMVLRCVKYSFLFLVLTFLAYFVFEVTSKDKRKIHPIQYLMIGGAMLIFYLLLVSMSEIIPFNFAYTISTVMTVTLISLYTHFVLGKKENGKFAGFITALLFTLYAFLYTLLVLQDLSLILGSFILFITMAVVMYATRNVQWYE